MIFRAFCNAMIHLCVVVSTDTKDNIISAERHNHIKTSRLHVHVN